MNIQVCGLNELISTPNCKELKTEVKCEIRILFDNYIMVTLEKRRAYTAVTCARTIHLRMKLSDSVYNYYVADYNNLQCNLLKEMAIRHC